jgi:uncharacterized protein YoxC
MLLLIFPKNVVIERLSVRLRVVRTCTEQMLKRKKTMNDDVAMVEGI